MMTPKPKFRRIEQLMLSSAWAILPDHLPRYFAILDGDGIGPTALSTALGRPLDGGEAAVVRGSVAIISCVGPIMRFGGGVLQAISSATSIDVLARDFTAALSDPAITAVVIDFSSPGGAVDGTNELADIILAARSRKRVVAYVGGTCASAAYWLASACSSIVVDATAILGSIGVVMGVPNPAANVPAKQIEIVSSQSPNKHPDVLTKPGRAQYQETVDSLATIMIASVARNRGLSPDVVAGDTWKRGGVLVGADAVKAKMADRLGSFEGLLAELGVDGGRTPTARARANYAEAPRLRVGATTTPVATTPVRHAPQPTLWSLSLAEQGALHLRDADAFQALLARSGADAMALVEQDWGRASSEVKTAARTHDGARYARAVDAWLARSAAPRATTDPDGSRTCHACKASAATDAKFCTACGLEIKDEDDDEDEDEDQEERATKKARASSTAFISTKRKEQWTIRDFERAKAFGELAAIHVNDPKRYARMLAADGR